MPTQPVIEKLKELQKELENVSVAVKHIDEAAKVAGVMRFLAKPYTADSVLKAVADAVRN